jgi:hypothetical protein
MQDFRAILHSPNMFVLSGVNLTHVVNFVTVCKVLIGYCRTGIVRIKNRIRRHEKRVGDGPTSSGHYLGLVGDPSNLNVPNGIE